MKILIPYDVFPGGFLTSIGKSFESLGYTVVRTPRYTPSLLSKVLNRIDSFGVLGIKKQIRNNRRNAFNNLLVSIAKGEKADMFFGISGGGYDPNTIRQLKKIGVKTVSYIADNPCDPRRDKYYAMSLRHYDVLLYADEIWMKILDKLAPESHKIKFLGGFDPSLFFYENILESDKEQYSHLSHDIVFTGGSYKESAEGAYRAGVLGQLADLGYNIKIWGDVGWDFRKQFYPGLSKSINTSRLSYEELRMMLRLSKIYINMPSPQIFTSLQPRVFEIAAAKGFQIIDHSDELDNIFGEDYVSFKTFEELTEKIDYYLKHPNERKKITEKMYTIVHNEYTWTNQVSKVIKQILDPL